MSNHQNGWIHISASNVQIIPDPAFGSGRSLLVNHTNKIIVFCSYNEEKFFAFFPLYPLLIRIYSDIMSVMTNHIIAFNEACILVGWLLNTVFFIGWFFIMLINFLTYAL